MYDIVPWCNTFFLFAIGIFVLVILSWLTTQSRASRVQGVHILSSKEVLPELRTVTNWHQLGINLGLQTCELNKIEHDYQGNERRKQKMLDLWLRRTPNAAWSDVACGLQQMGENRVAESIRQKYIRGSVQNLTMSDQDANTFKSSFSEADTDREKRGLRRLLQIHEPTHNAESEIQYLLTEAGLEPTQWLSILKTQLGVRTPQGLQHIGSESYADLKRFARKSGEKRALRKLLGIKDEETTIKLLREKQKEKLQQRGVIAQNLLKELTTLQKQGPNYHDRNHKHLLDCVQEVLQIPEGSWVMKDTMSLETLLSNLNTITEHLGKELKTSNDLTDVEVLRNASCGRALQGVLVSRNLEDQFEIRKKLLSVPQDAQLTTPFLLQAEKLEEFSSQDEENQFMDRFGYSATPSAKAGLYWFGLQASKGTEKVKVSNHQQKELYCSTIKYSFMPMASFYFKSNQLQLSADALADLQAIEAFSGSQNALQIQCEQFYRKYGSHANKGHLQFGGIYLLKCSSYGFCGSDIAEVKKLQNQVVNALVGSTSGGLIASVKGNVSKLKPSFKDDFGEALLSKTTMKVTLMGGHQAAFNIPLWKIGLVTSNITWSVIDCGSNIVPVWEIIQINHMKNFRDPKRLLQILIVAWEKMTKLLAPSFGGEMVLQATDSAHELMTIMDSWNDKKDQTKCGQHLKELIQWKLNVNKRSMTFRAWPVFYLSGLPVQNYLKWVVKATEGENQGNCKYIKCLMQQLVDPLDLHLVENFPEKHYVAKWLYQSDQAEDILPLKYEDILSLQNFIKQALENLSLTMGGIGPVPQEALIHATTCVTRVVNHLHDHLHKANQKYEDLFIVTLLYPFRYDVSEKIFLRLLSTDDLNCLIKGLVEQWAKYFSIKETNLLRKQAYLFFMAISVFITSDKLNIDISESHVKQHLQYMQKTLQNDLHPQVEDAITMNCTDSETGYDWTAIQSGLTHLMPGLKLTPDHEGPALVSILSPTPAARDDISISEQRTVPDEDIHPRSNAVPEIGTHEEPSQAFQILLKMLNLEEHYMQKLTLTDAVCVCLESVGSLQRTERPKLLPYFFMQKIMMHNYKSRKYILHNPQGNANTDYKDDNYYAQEQLTLHEENDWSGYTYNRVHPMDRLLALILCTDNFLRQYLMAKLSTCKLAIPFLLPDPKAQTLNFPLWAIRSIVMEWKSKFGDTECRIVDCKAPIVSFLRFSESKRSKSKMLNDVVCDSEHDIFFHRDCEGCSARHILVDGLMEFCWYLPAGKESDHFSNIVIFTNLHGDAREHKIQATFLSKVSFMNFVLIDQRDTNDQNGIKVLQDLANAPGGLVLIVEDGKVKIPEETLQTDMYNKIKIRGKNAATIRREIRCQITQKLRQHAKHSGEVSELKLTDCAEIARKLGIHVDEDIQECKEGKQLAIDLVAEITSLDTDPDSTASVKDRILPLQSPKLWHTWAKHDKEQHRHLNRGSSSIKQYNSEKETEKMAIRRLQLELADPPTTVTKLFISTLVKHKGSIREYFLQWLKMLLDDRSRSTLPQLCRQYKTKQREMNRLNEQHVEHSTLKSQLQMLNEQLVQMSFGLEHLLRELGQMYESVCDISSATRHRKWQVITVSEQLQSEVFYLPQIAAELLVTGYPLEIMDGDASHVPLTWVISVLDKLKEILGDKRLFILSVLGIQSTGKSTLMNTMFGLQFTVSAGRCTRGAFIQLLPLNEQLKAGIKCDYFLIVDTEGLRAPELDSAGTLKHDNEMATFVIGLADVTIINIFGEAPGEMDDILQTAMHAFLRIRNLELNPTCLFVHQNVVAISADAKGEMGRAKFHEKLDEMTRKAAMEEQCEGSYQSFKDVIFFDDEKDIWYFPTLWKGDPPMAPVNPGYSDKAHDLKAGIVALARQKGSQCTISEFQLRVKQLWEAVLDENFVFSFKNTLEITAYNELDAELTQWCWRLQRTMLEWEHENETVIRNAAFEKLHDLERERIANAKALLAKVHDELKSDINKFFWKSKHSVTLAQWRHRFERRLDDLRAELETQAQEHCKTMICRQQAQVAVKSLQDSYNKELQNHVKELVIKLDGKKQSEAELDSMFEEKWIELMQLAKLPKVYQQNVDINTAFERCLRGLLQKHDKQIIRKLGNIPLRMWGNSLHLQIQADKHCSCRWGSLLEEDVENAQMKTDSFLQTANQYLQDLKKRHIQNFHDGFIYALFTKVFETVNQFNTEGHNFKFTQEYNVDIALTVGGYALRHFEEMMEVSRKENDQVEYLKTLKVPLSKTFKSQYSQTAKAKTAADNFCYLLKTPIKNAVTRSLGHMVANEMMAKPTFQSKKALKAQILLDLGEKGSFECFALYLTDAKTSLQQWVKHYTNKYCTEVVGGKSRLQMLTEEKLQEIIGTITEAAKSITHSFPLSEKANNITEWLSQLHDHKQLSSVLTFDEKEIKQVVGAENLIDLKCFTDEIINGLHKMQESFVNEFQSSPLSQMDKWSKQPYDILCDDVLGCCEQCPFCGEQCELTTPNHDCSHSVQLHRPRCLGRYKVQSTRQMVLDLCSSAVASDMKFRNADTGHKWHSYREYKLYYPNWSITPDGSCQASSYWKWFMTTYSGQIAEHFNAKEGTIPDTWTSLTWEEVKGELKTLYNL